MKKLLMIFSLVTFNLLAKEETSYRCKVQPFVNFAGQFQVYDAHEVIVNPAGANVVEQDVLGMRLKTFVYIGRAYSIPFERDSLHAYVEVFVNSIETGERVRHSKESFSIPDINEKFPSVFSLTADLKSWGGNPLDLLESMSVNATCREILD